MADFSLLRAHMGQSRAEHTNPTCGYPAKRCTRRLRKGQWCDNHACPRCDMWKRSKDESCVACKSTCSYPPKKCNNRPTKGAFCARHACPTCIEFKATSEDKCAPCTAAFLLSLVIPEEDDEGMFAGSEDEGSDASEGDLQNDEIDANDANDEYEEVEGEEPDGFGDTFEEEEEEGVPGRQYGVVTQLGSVTHGPADGAASVVVPIRGGRKSSVAHAKVAESLYGDRGGGEVQAGDRRGSEAVVSTQRPRPDQQLDPSSTVLSDADADPDADADSDPDPALKRRSSQVVRDTTLAAEFESQPDEANGILPEAAADAEERAPAVK